MKHRTRRSEQDGLSRQRLVKLIDLHHDSMKLAARIDWKMFKRQADGFFLSTTVHPAVLARFRHTLTPPHAQGVDDIEGLRWRGA